MFIQNASIIYNIQVRHIYLYRGHITNAISTFCFIFYEYLKQIFCILYFQKKMLVIKSSNKV